MKRCLLLMTMAATVLILGCGSSSHSSTTQSTSDRRSELEAELREWGNRDGVALRAARSDVSAGENELAEQELSFARHDTEEMERIKVTLDASGAAR